MKVVEVTEVIKKKKFYKAQKHNMYLKQILKAAVLSGALYGVFAFLTFVFLPNYFFISYNSLFPRTLFTQKADVIEMLDFVKNGGHAKSDITGSESKNLQKSKELQGSQSQATTSLTSTSAINSAITSSSLSADISAEDIVVTHVKTPKSVRAIYMSSWVAGTPSKRVGVVSVADRTEINSVIIDIKDYTGKVAFSIKDNPILSKINPFENRIKDIKAFIASLHDKHIYVIGRVAVFQDPHLVSKKPEWAIKTKDGKKIWRDRKGIPWIDPGSEDSWKYIAEIAEGSYDLGFDEINFDYIRFPSDGDMKNISYPFSKNKIKSEVLKNFYKYIGERMAENGIVTSADLFGMTTTNRDDLSIGQILENALAYFDYVAPMVYPSHYPTGFLGIKVPAAKPYQVVSYSLDKAVKRAKAIKVSSDKIRPWLQDFSLGGVVYKADSVKAQIKATYDVGLDSWMLWNSSNLYTLGALEGGATLALSSGKSRGGVGTLGTGGGSGSGSSLGADKSNTYFDDNSVDVSNIADRSNISGDDDVRGIDGLRDPNDTPDATDSALNDTNTPVDTSDLDPNAEEDGGPWDENASYDDVGDSAEFSTSTDPYDDTLF